MCSSSNCTECKDKWVAARKVYMGIKRELQPHSLLPRTVFGTETLLTSRFSAYCFAAPQADGTFITLFVKPGTKPATEGTDASKKAGLAKVAAFLALWRLPAPSHHAKRSLQQSYKSLVRT